MDPASTAAPWLIAGLGNPGSRYERTRHNLGFMVIERLRQRWAAGPEKQAFDGLLSTAERPGGRVLLLRPMTFMNCSGGPIAQALRFYKVPREKLLVAVDDLALDPGRIRLRPSGSAGGHNGLKDIIARLGSDQFCRLRLGIGAAPAFMDAADYVLARMDEAAAADANAAVDLAVRAVEDWIARGPDEAMNRNN